MNKSFIVVTEYFVLIAIALAIAFAIHSTSYKQGESDAIEREMRSVLAPFDITVD